ncbi:MAG: tetratricopeptide repeat protein [Phycisphaerae bacterium]
MKPSRGVTAILTGRWQIPLAICAVVAGGLALHRMKPPKQDVPFDALLADILVLAEAGAYYDAADAAANLLKLRPPLPVRERVSLHNVLADIIYRQEVLRGLPNRRNTLLLVKHQEAALAGGLRLDGQAALRLGQGHEWLGEAQAAIAAYRAVLHRESSADARRIARQGLVRLLDGQAEAADERRQHIQTLLDEEGVSPGYLWWALQHAVQEALEAQDVERARELLTRHGQRFKRSDLKGYYDYLWAWAHVHEGQTEAAEPLIDRVDRWLAAQTRADAEMDQAGFLPAMSAWLRGRIHLAEARPQLALGCFDEALSLQSHGDTFVVTTIGRAQALGLLERHEVARQAVRDAVARLKSDPTTLSVGRPRLRQAVLGLLNRRHEEQDYENALSYLELALELTPEGESALRLDLFEHLGHENEEAAEAAGDADSQRALHLAAARAYEQAAELGRFDVPRYATLLWVGAAQFDRAGRTEDARRLLLRFIAGRSLDPRRPQALLRLGRACAASGRLNEAIKHYRQLIEDYPRLEEASQAKLLTADCFAALGEAHYVQAETILQDLLEDEDVAPQAQVFRDALFELCDLLYQQREYAAAISYMEEFLVFYPQDPERYRVRFMLADAYRGSALALRDGLTSGSEPARQRISRERFQRAAELFGTFLAGVAAAKDEAGDREPYERLALFYRGDCLFELNEPATLAEALAIYHQAAARYQGEPAALTAQVQIANIYLRQGKLTEAARAVERARWLLGSIPDRAFTEHDDGLDRASWDHFLTALGSSHLFQDVFMGMR